MPRGHPPNTHLPRRHQPTRLPPQFLLRLPWRLLLRRPPRLLPRRRLPRKRLPRKQLPTSFLPVSPAEETPVEEARAEEAGAEDVVDLLVALPQQRPVRMLRRMVLRKVGHVPADAHGAGASILAIQKWLQHPPGIKGRKVIPAQRLLRILRPSQTRSQSLIEPLPGVVLA